MKSVLIVDSIEDEITNNRHRILNSSPLLRDYIIHYCYSTEFDDTQKQKISIGQTPYFVLEEKELYSRIEEAIQKHNPDYILIHSGFVFCRYPEIFLDVIEKLKKSHPQIGLGLQTRPFLNIDSNFLNCNEEVIALEKLIFHEALSRREYKL
jgi:hypothetical protein